MAPDIVHGDLYYAPRDFQSHLTVSDHDNCRLIDRDPIGRKTIRQSRIGSSRVADDPRTTLENNSVRHREGQEIPGSEWLD